MITEITKLKKEFEKIKKKGYIKSSRKGPTGIGKTFEDLLEKEEDQNDTPDYCGIEIKTKLNYSPSFTKLFNATPLGKHEFEIKYLLQTYGYPHKLNKEWKVLQTSLYTKQLNNIGSKYYGILEINRLEKKIFLKIINNSLNCIEKNTYWTFDTLEKRLLKKLKYLAIVKANKRIINNEIYYHYYSLNIYTLKDFDTFLNLIEQQIIRI